MAEIIAIVAIITGVGGAMVSILHTLRSSECCLGFCKINTRTPPPTQPPSINIIPSTPAQSPAQSPAQQKRILPHIPSSISHDV